MKFILKVKIAEYLWSAKKKKKIQQLISVFCLFLQEEQ